MCQHVSLVGHVSCVVGHVSSVLVADHLPVGTQRRVAVACKFMNCGQLLVLHDALFGVNEGDGLAVLKALSDMCRSAFTSCKARCNNLLHQCVYHCKASSARRQL